jgi:hypothetical protein
MGQRPQRRGDLRRRRWETRWDPIAWCRLISEKRNVTYLDSLTRLETVSSLRREALSLLGTMSVLGREVLRIATAVINQHTWTSILLCGKPLNLGGKPMDRSHRNLLSLL